MTKVDWHIEKTREKIEPIERAAKKKLKKQRTSHPRCKLDWGSIEGQAILRSKLGLHCGIQLAEEGWDRVPEDGLDNERAALGLHLWRWLATAHLVTLPDGGDFAIETVVEQTLTVGRDGTTGSLGIGLGENLLDPLLLVEDGAAIHLGRMRR